MSAATGPAWWTQCAAPVFRHFGNLAELMVFDATPHVRTGRVAPAERPGILAGIVTLKPAPG